MWKTSKFDLWWPLVTWSLTWPKNWPNRSVIIFYVLSIAAYRMSLRGPGHGLEGGVKRPPPSTTRKTQATSTAQVKAPGANAVLHYAAGNANCSDLYQAQEAPSLPTQRPRDPHYTWAKVRGVDRHFLCVQLHPQHCGRLTRQRWLHHCSTGGQNRLLHPRKSGQRYNLLLKWLRW